MWHNLGQLFRYRGLIQSMVSRDLKARYRGSVLGFFWSFINPLLLLSIYSFVFTRMLPSSGPGTPDPYAVFLFCGLLPWTWFSSALMDATGSLVAGGNLIKKVMFPAEVLPIVSVLSTMVHFFLGLPILASFIIYYEITSSGTLIHLHFDELIWLPVVILVQFILTTGLALFLSSLTVHFRDIKDLMVNVLTFWFFATPIIYSWRTVSDYQHLLNLNPFTHLAVSYQEILFFPEDAFGHYKWLLALGGVSIVIFLAGYWVFDRLRDSFAGGCMSAVVTGRGQPAIELTNVSKIYRRYGGRHFATLKSAILQRSLLKDLRPDETFPALQDVSFSVPVGSTFGVIGRNGSGKSTALKLVAGITKPTSGTVKVRGRISALIELGAGFHPEISGRENVFINGIMLGLTKREIQSRFDEIVDFAELKDFIDAPVKTYSSGMYMRLGFAVAINVNPDVLLVDEVLAVGDEGFTHKCLDKFGEFKRRGKTVLLVTHSLGMVERFCDEAVWLDAGRRCAEGDPTRVIGQYMTDVAKQEEKFLAASDARAQESVGHVTTNAATATVASDDVAADMSKATEGRWGLGGVEIHDITFLDGQGQPSQMFHSGDPMTVRFTVRADRPVADFVFGIGIFNAEGVCVYGTNTDLEKYESEELSGTATVDVSVDALDLVEGTYKLDLAVHKRDGAPYDYHRLLHTFRVKSPIKDVGIYRPRHHWTFSAGARFKPPRP